MSGGHGRVTRIGGSAAASGTGCPATRPAAPRCHSGRRHPVEWHSALGHTGRPWPIATELDIRPLSPLIGAEIHGVDLSRPLAEEVVAEVRQALNTHHVIFFRDQQLSPDQQADFARQFGEVTEGHPVIPAIEGNPEVLAIDGRDDRASWWHTDVTFLQAPAFGSILYMRGVPRGRRATPPGPACRTPTTGCPNPSAPCATR